MKKLGIDPTGLSDEHVLALASGLVDTLDDHKKAGTPSDSTMSFFRSGVSVLVGITPVGTVFDVATVLTGRDLITGERVSFVGSLAGLVPGVSEARKVAKLLDMSPNQINKLIRKGQAPSGIERIDSPKVTGEQYHAVVNGGSLNVDGTWKHLPKKPLTNAQRTWLESRGWRLRK